MAPQAEMGETDPREKKENQVREAGLTSSVFSPKRDLARGHEQAHLPLRWVMHRSEGFLRSATLS